VLFHTATEFESIEQLTTMKTKAFLLIRRDRNLFLLRNSSESVKNLHATFPFVLKAVWSIYTCDIAINDCPRQGQQILDNLRCFRFLTCDTVVEHIT